MGKALVSRRAGTIALGVVCVFIILLVGACDGGSSGKGGATGTPELDAIATGVAQTCFPARPHETGDDQEMIVSGGMSRQYILHVPNSYTGDDAVPLVISLHGYSSDARRHAVYTGLSAKADEAGFIVVTPQGIGDPTFWNFLNPGEPDDVAFIGDLVDRLASQLCIDPARIYVTGFSNGAAMSVTLACRLTGRIAAIAAVSGVFFLPGCASGGPVSVIVFHGTDDVAVPFEGGSGGTGLPVPPIEQSTAAWAEHDGCAAEAQDEQVTAHVRRVRYQACDGGATVELYVVEGGGHTWPGAMDIAVMGETTHEISATDLMWEFFLAHPRR